MSKRKVRLTRKQKINQGHPSGESRYGKKRKARVKECKRLGLPEWYPYPLIWLNRG